MFAPVSIAPREVKRAADSHDSITIVRQKFCNPSTGHNIDRISKRNRFFGRLAFLALLLAASAVSAESFYVVQAPGHATLFTNARPASGKIIAELKFTSVSFAGRYWDTQPSAYDQLIHRTASAKGIDPALVKAVVHAESAFNPRARSRKGAMGLMQLMPDTARFLGVQNPYEPGQNIRGGVAYLAQLLIRYEGDLKLSLAAYNAGPEAVDRYSGVPPYRETIDYVKRVLKLRDQYRRG
jgi:soluble lytic murein transglycosylase-like protein